jgi:hypothetical protein
MTYLIAEIFFFLFLLNLKSSTPIWVILINNRYLCRIESVFQLALIVSFGIENDLATCLEY